MDEQSRQASQAAQAAINAAQAATGARRGRAAAPADDAQQAVTDSAPSQPERVIRPLGGDRIKLAEFCGSQWKVFVPAGVEVEDLINPQLWFAANKFQAYDLVQVIAPQWFALCMVTDVGPGRTTVSVLLAAPVFRTPIPNLPAAVPTGYEIRQSEPGARSAFEVFRPHDGVLVSAGVMLPTYDDAIRWAVDFVSSLQRDHMRVLAGRR